jgi:hypothetical protein
MSGGNIKGGALQIGQDGTASNNFTLYQPAVVDGTVRLGVGVVGATTKDMITVSGTNITLGGNLIQASTAAPAFSAYNSSVQSIAHNTFSKVQFQTENFDTNNNFDNSTNYRFTPTVAGYYHVTEQVALNSLTANSFSGIYKNGGAIAYSPVAAGWTGIANTLSSIAVDVYMNGTTDYLEVYVYQASGGSLNTINSANATMFSAFLARSA